MSNDSVCDVILLSLNAFWASSPAGGYDDSQSLGLCITYCTVVDKNNQRKSQEEKKEIESKHWWSERKGVISKFAKICAITLFNWRREYFPRCQVYLATPLVTRLIFWFVRHHPRDQRILFSVINSVPPRTRKTKTVTRRAYICMWNTETWDVERIKKVGDRGLTCFDIRYESLCLKFAILGLGLILRLVMMVASLAMAPRTWRSEY